MWRNPLWMRKHELQILLQMSPPWLSERKTYALEWPYWNLLFWWGTLTKLMIFPAGQTGKSLWLLRKVHYLKGKGDTSACAIILIPSQRCEGVSPHGVWELSMWISSQLHAYIYHGPGASIWPQKLASTIDHQLRLLFFFNVLLLLL